MVGDRSGSGAGMTRAATARARRGGGGFPPVIVAEFNAGGVRTIVTEHRRGARRAYAVHLADSSGRRLPVVGLWRTRRCAEFEALAIATGADIVAQLGGEVVA